ncbi:MAG: DUF2161 domain-containing phosphodiesterase [Roseobacter sp.]
MANTAREIDLYPAVKAFLEAQGYAVKSEIAGVDVMALRGADPPVIVELKTGFSLTLFHQAVERLSISDSVYIAVEHKPGKRFSKSIKQAVGLARRLGVGVLTVRIKDGLVTVHADPGPYAPRKSKRKQAVLLKEFAKRRGDPNKGGQQTTGLVTAYRQDCTKIALYLYEAGATRGAHVAKEIEVPQATRMMRDNHYGWFEKVETGVYGLTPLGADAVKNRISVLEG